MNAKASLHALDEGWLLDCASGAAPRAVCVLAEAQAAISRFAARQLRATEAAFGALLEGLPGSPPSDATRNRVFAAIDGEVGAPAKAAPLLPADPVFPPALKQVLERAGGPGWRARFGGYAEIVLEELCEDGVHARLLNLPAGKSAPEHDHRGEEMTLVLSGSFVDQRGRYARGDVCASQPGVVHRPRVDSDVDCICFAVEFGGWKLTNPILGAADRLLPGRR